MRSVLPEIRRIARGGSRLIALGVNRGPSEGANRSTSSCTAPRGSVVPPALSLVGDVPDKRCEHPD